MFFTVGPHLTVGKYGNAIFVPNLGTLDDNYISLGGQTDNCLDNMKLCPSGMTMSFWLKASQQNHNWPQIIFSTAVRMYLKRTSTNLLLQGFFSDEKHIEAFEDAATVTMEKWHLLALSYSEDQFQFYFDGCKVETEPRIVPKSSTKEYSFTMGCREGYRNCARNHYDEFRFWKTAKSPRFIHWLWQN